MLPSGGMLDFPALCCFPLLLLVFIGLFSSRGIWSLFSFSSSLLVSIMNITKTIIVNYCVIVLGMLQCMTVTEEVSVSLIWKLIYVELVHVEVLLIVFGEK